MNPDFQDFKYKKYYGTRISKEYIKGKTGYIPVFVLNAVF
jgi:hypothetical protein